MTKSHVTALVADLGGTNTRVALTDGATVLPDTIRRFRNAEAKDLSDVLRQFVGQSGVIPDAACVAMAGPVFDGIGRLTNLDWHVTRDDIAAATGAGTVAVLNDLQAQGHALDHLTHETLRPICSGETARAHAARLVVGVGTGMNAAAVFKLDGRTLVPPSEAGHVSLPVQSEDERALLDWLSETHGVPGLEDVLSGRGFEHVYAWRSGADAGTRATSADRIMTLAADGDETARDAIALFVRFLGRAVGNLALIHLPFGGIYLCGGVARHFTPHLGPFGFEAAFRDKGRFSTFLEQFPIYLIEDDYAALTGSAQHLVELMAVPAI